jgi:hypothetical protein
MSLTLKTGSSLTKLSSCSTVLHEKLTGRQLVKKFPTFYGNPKVHYRIHNSPPPVLYTIKLFFEKLTKQEMPTDRNTRGTFIILLPPIIFRLI